MPTIDGKKTYEYFASEDIVIHGKYAEYVEKLWTLNDIKNSYFNRLVDLIVIASAIGIRLHIKGDEDFGEKKHTIQLAQVVNVDSSLKPLMKLALMFDDGDGLSKENRVRNAFRPPEDEETYRHNMDIFYSYMRGGIELLYERLVLGHGNNDTEDYGNSDINHLIALIKTPFNEADEFGKVED